MSVWLAWSHQWVGDHEKEPETLIIQSFNICQQPTEPDDHRPFVGFRDSSSVKRREEIGEEPPKQQLSQLYLCVFNVIIYPSYENIKNTLEGGGQIIDNMQIRLCDPRNI